MSSNTETLKEKYGEQLVLGINASLVSDILKEGYTCRKNAIIMDDGVYQPLSSIINKQLKPSLRYIAETDKSFLQVIPYAVIEHKGTGDVFCTKRVGGDNRLLNQLSLGLGGHIDPYEGIYDALYRELEEEVGLTRKDLTDVTFCGFIRLSETEVDKVHLGMVYHVYVDRRDLECKEEDVLEGRWLDETEINSCYESRMFESWSEIICQYII